MTETDERREAEQSVDLKNQALAATLAWLVPGLGHLYQGRTAKAGLFFICIMTTFLFGLYLGGSSEVGWGRVVYFTWEPGNRRLPYLCQIGIGLPAMPALLQAFFVNEGMDPPLGNFMAPPPLEGHEKGVDAQGRSIFDHLHDAHGRPTLDKLHRKLARNFELGTVYTMIAGLLNILAIYDAGCGPVFGETAKKEEEEDGEDEDDELLPEIP